MNFSKESLETTYCFIHQKQRVYQYSTMDWQKDDIEYAIDSFVSDIDSQLYDFIAKGKPDFLRDHNRFGEDMIQAVDILEKLLFGAQ